MKRMPKVVTNTIAMICLLALALVPLRTAEACSVPVFQYALQYWHADTYRATVFHEGPLAPAQEALLEQFKKEVLEAPAAPNLMIRLVDVAQNDSAAAAELYETQQPTELPWIVLQYGMPGMGTGDSVAWSGKLSTRALRGVVDSPVRQEAARRLLEGQATVWILVDSGSPEADEAAEKVLRDSISELQESLRVPVMMDGGADLYYDPQGVPSYTDPADEDADWEMKTVEISVIRVGRDDPQESFLRDLLLKVDPTLTEATEPVAFPLCGRGRVLTALVGEEINRDNIEMLVGFATGPCSCTVKAQNPGFDLLMSVAWDYAIWGAQEADEPIMTGLTGAFAVGAAEAEPAKQTAPSEASTDRAHVQDNRAGVEEPEMPEYEPTASRWPGSVVTGIAVVVGIGVLLIAGGTVLIRRKSGD